MSFVKISNLIQKNGIADYKGLDINKIIPGTQFYPAGESVAYFQYSESVQAGGDVTILTEEEYKNLMKEIEANQPSSIEDELAQLKEQVVAQQSAINMLLGV